MTGEQAQKVLDELNTVRIEVLNDEAKRLFEAIMKIADERDKIEQEYDRDTHILQNQLDLANAKNIEKDKIIDLMAKCIDIELSSSRLGKILNKNVKPLESYKKDIKQYFEYKAKEK